MSLTVAAGDFVAIMGPSGCGKSTLLHMLGGLEPPDQGSVTIQGIDVYALGDEERSAFRRDHIGVVFQFFNLLPTLTAAENVALPLRLRNEAPGRRGQKLSRQAIRARVDALMVQLNLHGLQGHGPRRSRAASSSGSRSPARSQPPRPCCSLTSRPVTSTGPAATR